MEKSALAEAAYKGDLTRVHALIAAGADLSGIDGGLYHGAAEGCVSGRPYYVPISEAARNGKVDVVCALLAGGAAVDEINYRGETALILAAQAGQIDVVRALLDAGADPNHVGCFGPALAYLASPTVAAALLDAGARLDVSDPLGVDVLDQICAVPVGEKRFGDWRYHEELLSRKRTIHRDFLTVIEPYAAEHAERVRAAIVALTTLMDAAAAATDAERQRYVSLGSAEQVSQPDWAERIGALLDLDSARPLCEWTLASPAAVGHPGWPDLVRQVVALSRTYADVTLEVYGQQLSLDEMDNDDVPGVWEFYSDDHLYTFDWVLVLLATPAAIDHPQWADLVVDLCTAKRAAVSYMSFGDDEVAALLASPAVQKHSRFAELTAAARVAFPFAPMPDRKQAPPRR